MEQLQEALRLLVRCIVNNEDAVRIELIQTGTAYHYIIWVARGEARMVIGRGGEMIRRIRKWAYAAATRKQVRVNIEVQERE